MCVYIYIGIDSPIVKNTPGKIPGKRHPEPTCYVRSSAGRGLGKEGMEELMCRPKKYPMKPTHEHDLSNLNPKP